MWWGSSGHHLRPGLLGMASIVLSVTAIVALLPANAVATSRSAQPCEGADCDVVGEPDGAEYVGTGGLLLPADSFTGSTDDRSDAATCADCQWALLPMCRNGQGGDVACGGAAASCPPGEFRRIVLLLRPGDTDWQEVGLVCLVGGAPTTVDDVAQRLSDVVVEEVPELSPTFQPRGGTLVGLPAIFDAGQPRTLGERSFTLVGFEIVLRGRATWTWAFGDGESVVTDAPGGEWPNTDVSHAYARSGQYEVGVVTEWEAWFSVDGMGPWPVGGAPVTQTSDPLPLTVLEARAQLVTG